MDEARYDDLKISLLGLLDAYRDLYERVTITVEAKRETGDIFEDDTTSFSVSFGGLNQETR